MKVSAGLSILFASFAQAHWDVLKAGAHTHTRSNVGYGRPKVYIVEPKVEQACKTQFHIDMMKEIKKYEVKNPAHADFVFVNVDTLRQVLWPEYEVWAQALQCNYNYTVNPRVILFDRKYDDARHLYIKTARKYLTHHSYPGQKLVYFMDTVYYQDKGTRDHMRAQLEELGSVLFVGQTVLHDDAKKSLALNVPMPLLPAMRPAQQEKMRGFESRKIFASFQGRRKSNEDVRGPLFDMEIPDGLNVLIRESGASDRDGKGNPASVKEDFKKLLEDTKFSLSPRGDHHYSLRMVESLAYGSVPVLLDDDMEPYFGHTKHDYAIFIPENQAGRSLQILQQNVSVSQAKAILRHSGKKLVECSRSMERFVGCTLRAAIKLSKDHDAAILSEI
ncbi:hypothetical protein AAMO2058_000813800 [Amorphochlora amoebiformis]